MTTVSTIAGARTERHHEFRVLHVLGTLRKGGVTCFVASILRARGDFGTRHDLLLASSSTLTVKQEWETNDSKYCFYEVSLRTGSIVKSLRTVWRIARGYDALMVHAAHPVVVLPLALLRKQCLLFQHGMSVSSGPALIRRIRKWWFSSLSFILKGRVICATTHAHRKALDFGISIRQRKVAIVPFGVSLSRERAARTHFRRPGALTVGMAGRLVAQKRHELPIRSLAEYAGRTPIRLLIAGDGPLREYLHDLSQEVGPTVSVEFLGEVDDMAEFYDRIDFFVFPSEGESFGLVVPEAFDRCVPVAVFPDVGGCLDLVRDGENGFVLNEGVDGLVKLWNRLDRDPNTILSMSRRLAAQDLQFLSIEQTRRQLDALAGYRPRDGDPGPKNNN